MVRWAALLALIAAPSVNVSAFTIKHSTLTLSNGFRVILAPDRSVPVAAMAMLIPVGARQETKGRSGFAHLFEHLMFDGSAHVKKGQFDKILEGLGAESNASTHMDMTFYYESVPSNALPVAFWLDADRMSELRVFKKNMRNQIEVVKEEKRLSVFNEPYMPLLWVEIQKKIFSNWANAHDTYGGFEDLDAADLSDVKRFFADWYAPSNTILAVVGDFDPEQARRGLERYFSWIPDRSARGDVDLSEPAQAGPRTFRVPDKHARVPALATVWSGTPDRGSRDYYALTLIGRYLYAGKSARLYQRLVKEERVATSIDEPYAGGLGFPVSDWDEYREPGLFGGIVLHKPEVSPERLQAIIDDEIKKLMHSGVPPQALKRVKTKFKSDWVVGAQAALGRAWILLRHAALDGNSARANGELDRFMAVSVAETKRAAERFLGEQARNVFIVTPGKAGS